MPETVFFKDGKIAFLTVMDRDCCLNIDSKIDLSNTIKVRDRLNEVVKERKKDTELHGR